MPRSTWKSLAQVGLLTGLLASAAGTAVAADTSAPDGTGIPQWARWQGRLSLGLTSPTGRADLSRADAGGLQVGSFSLLGDYYFGDAARSMRYAGGFRATSGVIVGQRSNLWSGQASLTSSRGMLGLESRRLDPLAPWSSMPETAPDTSAVPYLGVGYTGLSLRSHWSFSADLGMVARSPGQAVKLGRVLTGSQGVEDLLRDLRLAPLVQLGVSYSF